MNNKKLISIDILKGIAAFGVYYYHQHIGAVLAAKTGFDFLKYTDAFGAIYSVPLFFLISGYCIHLSNIKRIRNSENLDLIRYYKKRFWRIYPPYLLTLLISIIVNKIIMPTNNINMEDMIVHFLSFQGFSVAYFNTINIVLWTISIELAFYFIYPVFYKIRLKYGIFNAMLCCFIVSGLSISYFYFKGNISPPERFFVLNFWFAWCFGACLSELIEQQAAKQKYWYSRFGLCYFLFLIAFIMINFISWNNDFLIKDELNVLAGAGPLVYLVKKEIWLIRFNRYGLNVIAAIGLSGYSLYLLHEPLILLKNYLITEYLNQFKNILMAASVFIIPAVCYINYYIFEKPFINFGRQITNN